MAAYHGFPTIQVLVGPDKESAETRLVCGVRIGSQAPQSTLYQTEPEVKEAVDGVTAATAELQAAREEFLGAEAALFKAKTKLQGAVVNFDGFHGVFVAVAEKHCKSEQDGATLGVTVRKGTKSQLQPPISIDATYNRRKDWIHIHVHRAPGTSSLVVEVSTDGINFHELDGDGAIHIIQNPAPGTYWVRALAKSAREKSEYTTPVSVTVV